MKTEILSTFVDNKQIARMMEFDTVEMFTNRRRDLVENHAFPRPVPFCKRPMKHRRRDVERWLDFAGRNGADGLPATSGKDAAKVIMFNAAGRP